MDESIDDLFRSYSALGKNDLDSSVIVTYIFLDECCIVYRKTMSKRGLYIPLNIGNMKLFLAVRHQCCNLYECWIPSSHSSATRLKYLGPSLPIWRAQ